MSRGEAAEELVVTRLRAALPPDHRLFASVQWIARTADHRGLRDGEADVVLAHPDLGFLVTDDRRLDRLLYVGASRARQHLVVIAPAGVA